MTTASKRQPPPRPRALPRGRIHWRHLPCGSADVARVGAGCARASILPLLSRHSTSSLQTRQRDIELELFAELIQRWAACERRILEFPLAMHAREVTNELRFFQDCACKKRVHLESFVMAVFCVEAPEARQERNKDLIAGPCKSQLGGTSSWG